MTDDNAALIRDILALKRNLLLRIAGDYADGDAYQQVRRRLLYSLELASVLPPFLHTAADLSEFTTFINAEQQTPTDRRRFIETSFAPALAQLGYVAPRDSAAADALQRGLSAQLAANIEETWAQARERQDSNPPRAVALAHQMLKQLCQALATELKLDVATSQPVTKIYRQLAGTLGLAPRKNDSEPVRQMRLSLYQQVSAIELLQKQSAAQATMVSPEDAELAVTTAGVVAHMLLDRWERTTS